MTVKERLHAIVDDLDEERAAEALAYLDELASAPDDEGTLPGLRAQRREGPPIMSGRAFFSAPAKSLEELAREQGVGPITDVSSLRGDFWPEDETADEFIEAVRQWRRDGGCA